MTEVKVTHIITEWVAASQWKRKNAWFQSALLISFAPVASVAGVGVGCRKIGQLQRPRQHENFSLQSTLFAGIFKPSVKWHWDHSQLSGPKSLSSRVLRWRSTVSFAIAACCCGSRLIKIQLASPLAMLWATSVPSSMSKAPEAKGQLRLLNLKWKGVYINDKFELKHGLARASNPWSGWCTLRWLKSYLLEWLSMGCTWYLEYWSQDALCQSVLLPAAVLECRLGHWSKEVRCTADSSAWNPEPTSCPFQTCSACSADRASPQRKNRS